MEILNVGVPELIIILILMFVLLGPKEMIRTANRIGTWIRKAIKSPMWKEVMGYSQEIRELPQKIMDESGLKETLEEVRRDTQAATNEINTSLKEVADSARVKEAEHVRIEFDPNDTNTIAPPAAQPVEEPVEVEAAAELSAEEPALVETTLAETAPVEDAPAELPLDAETPASTSPTQGGIAGAIAAAAAEAEAKAAEKAEEKPQPQRANRPQPGANVVGIPVIQPAVVNVAPPAPPAPQETEQPAEPVKTRKPRRKKTDETDAAVVPVTLDVAPQGAAPQAQQDIPVVEETPRKPRGRKPKQAETVSLTGAQVYSETGAVNENGNGNGAASAEVAPVKRARKPRASKPSPDNGSTPDHSSEANPTPEEQSHNDAA